MSAYRPRRRLLAFTLALAVVLALAGCITVNAPLSSAGDPGLHETTISGGGADKILWLPVTGFISSHPQSSAFGLVHNDSVLTQVERSLDKAADDDAIKAVILRIDSPGGTVAASDEIYHRITAFHQATGKPVIASLGGVAASGGYYIAMAADEVIAQPTTITGSIGVIIVNVNAAGLLDKLGLRDASVTSGVHKDLLSPLRPPRPDEQAIVDDVVDALFQRFVGVVRTSRGARLDRDQLATITDGRIFSATAAQRLGLVDAIAHRDEVVTRAERRIGASDARLVRYYRGKRAPDTLSAGAAAGTHGASASLVSQLAESTLTDATTPLYLWRGLAR